MKQTKKKKIKLMNNSRTLMADGIAFRHKFAADQVAKGISIDTIY